MSSLCRVCCQIKGRTIRVDHVKDYRPPKDTEDIDDITKHLREEGCAPKAHKSSSSSSEEDEQYTIPVKKTKKGEVTSCLNLICSAPQRQRAVFKLGDKKTIIEPTNIPKNCRYCPLPLDTLHEYSKRLQHLSTTCALSSSDHFNLFV